ncbi:MAG: RsmB/NOP family class I SAM-dependent RNA methyltransferase, partial [Tannerellaceae bacterium]|nr:RsmB/NOP family class I SAM-dependent RNA methyltransferase [Tannerellaceae bacterium]
MILPADFLLRMQILTGAACASFHAALQSPPPVSVRLNPAKGPADPGEESVSWCSCGYYLKERPSFTFDPLFHAGAYYVQEASSMFLEQAIRAHVSGPVKCLDLCAAPGGKSTHLQALLPAGSLLVSNEILKSRAAVLQENLIKWGNPGALVTSNHPAEMSRLPHFFDVVVADLPCSGEGMFRKDPSSAAQWSANNVAGCALRQRRILHDCWDALKPGGLLIYCTCTYNIEENEDNLQYIIQTLGGEALPVPVRDEWKITGALKYNHPAYRFFPHLTRGEGFFLAVIQKQEGRALPVRNEKGRKNGDARRNLSPDVSHWLKHPSD